MIFCLLSQNAFSQEKNSLENLTMRADIIIIGTVTEIKSQWNKDKTRIWSFVKINFEENIKGNNIQDEVTIRVLGGEIDGIGMKVSNSPEFELKQRFLCFLQKDTNNTFAVVGWEAGKFIFQNGIWSNKISKISNTKIIELKKSIHK